MPTLEQIALRYQRERTGEAIVRHKRIRWFLNEDSGLWHAVVVVQQQPVVWSLCCSISAPETAWDLPAVPTENGVMVDDMRVRCPPCSVRLGDIPARYINQYCWEEYPDRVDESGIRQLESYREMVAWRMAEKKLLPP